MSIIASMHDDWAEHTLLAQRWIVIRQQVELHKWYESEKAGHDIGWERAFVDWLLKHSNSFFKSLSSK